MFENKNSAENIVMNILKLNAIEFLGVCKIIGVEIYSTETSEAEYAEGGRANVNVELHARPFEDIWNDVCDVIDSMNREEKRKLNRLVNAALKEK